MDVNELRRLLEAGQITPDQLSQMSMSGSFDGGQNALAQMVMPQPRFDVAPMQMNTMRAENGPDAGKVTNLNFTGAPGTPQAPTANGTFLPPQAAAANAAPRMMQVIGSGNGTTVTLTPEQAPDRVNIDYSRPQVDTMGGKAYYSKDEPGVAYVMGPDGRPKAKVVLGYDMQGSMALTKANLEQQKTLAETAHTQEQTRASQANNPDFGPAVGGAMNAGVTGADFLKTLDPAVANEIKSIGDGDVAFNPRSPRQMQILGLVKQYNPAFSGNEFTARAQTTKDFATGGKSGQVVQAINQALHHASTVSDAIDKLDNFDTLPIANTPVNWVEKNILGDTRQGQFSTSAMALAEELKKIYAGGGGGSLKELETWQQSFDPNAGKKQQKAYLAQGMNLLQGAMEARQEAYQRGMGPSADFGKLFSPQALDALKKLQGGGYMGSGQPQPSEAPSGMPKMGEVRKGFRYKGGNPAQQSSWEPA
jgi:hypothetical protein